MSSFRVYGPFRKPKPRLSRRRGVILILASAAMIMVLAFAVFSIDVGYIALTKGQLQNAADAAALAAASELSGVLDPAEVEALAKEAAIAVAAANRAGNHDSVFLKPENVQLGRRTFNPETQRYEFEYGPQAVPYNIVKVTVQRVERIPDENDQATRTAQDEGLPLFFAPVLGYQTADLTASAIASFQPRDIVVVLDFSASMNDDSELSAYFTLDPAEVQANQQKIWADLGSPTYGKLPVVPAYVTMKGRAASGSIPHITVEWRETSVYVTSTKDLSNVVLKFEDGSTQKFDGLSGKTGTFQGTGNKSGKVIETVWVKSGSNSSGDCSGCGERFDYTTTNIRNALGLDAVSYPYASGSWNDYINYVNTSSVVRKAGYRRKFGAYTLINYWLEQRPGHNQTSDLWKVSAQPLQAVKDGVYLLLNHLRESGGEDKVGLSIYTYSNGDATLESPLTDNLNLIETITRQRQAGHYDQYTNISAGMRKAREELVANARPKAERVMVLMTDGIANRPNNENYARQMVIQEANAAAAAKIRILTISVGAGADTNLMQQVADITGGEHFNVPGGGSVAMYSEQLKEVFGRIAVDRPLRLIHDVDD